mmetsp:Transcript_15140/g.23458  ORF Transcript_15140/g.23458 Transcript_15140/m.23458 type:complete len:307 (-) Transcript_15140:261-1181(-)
MMRCPVVTSLFLISSVIEVNSFSIPSSSINNNIVLRSTTDNASIAVDLKDDIDNRIDKVLEEKRQELLSDNNNNEQLAREVLLSSRLPGLNFLNRSEVRPSRILGAGRGLFATEGIPKGQVITCYPGDALLTKSDEYNDLLWGTHVPTADLWDGNAVFEGTESSPPLTSYSVSVDEKYSVLGLPSLDDNPAYFGHYANDGAGIDEFGLDIEEELGEEGNIASYVSRSNALRNAVHTPFKGGTHMVTVATRDIQAGEEILVTYGPDYWGITALVEEASFRNRVGQLLTSASLLFTFVSVWLFITSIS